MIIDEARLRVLFDRLGTDLTREDFAALCLACADQADVPVRDQKRIEQILEENETRQFRGYMGRYS